MAKIWMVFLGAVVLAVLLQIKTDGKLTLVTTTGAGSRHNASDSASTSSSGGGSNPSTSSPSQSSTNSTGRAANLHCSSGVLLPLTISASIAYLCC